MRILPFVSTLLAGWAVALAAHAAIFSFEFAYDGPGTADIPNSVELVDNGIVHTTVQVINPTKLELYRLEQEDPAGIAANLGAPDDNIDLLFGGARYPLVEQAYDLGGVLIGTQTFSGGFDGSLGLGFNDPGFGNVDLFYGFLPFVFYVDDTASYGGIPFGSQTGASDVIWFRLPSDSGLYRLQAAAVVPEPATWAMMIGGFALTGATLRRSRKAATAAG